MKKALQLIVLGGVLTIAACSKPSKKETENKITFHKLNAQISGIQVSRDHGYLIFKDVETYENMLHILSAMTDGELNNWEASLSGFTSVYTAFGFDIEDPSLVPTGDKNSKAFDPLFKRIINQDALFKSALTYSIPN